jgi:hypothetical protein
MWPALRSARSQVERREDKQRHSAQAPVGNQGDDNENGGDGREQQEVSPVVSRLGRGFGASLARIFLAQGQAIRRVERIRAAREVFRPIDRQAAVLSMPT